MSLSRITMVLSLGCGLLLTTSACKKKVAAGPGALPSDPVEEAHTAPDSQTSPAASPASTNSTEEEARPEPEATPEPSAKPAERSDRGGAKKKSLRKKVNAIVSGLGGSDVSKNRDALSKLKALQESSPDEATIDLNIGVAEQLLGNVSAAKKAYESAKAKDDTLGHAYLYLGVLKEEAGDLTGAEALYRDGIAKDPENVDIRVGLVSTLRKQGRIDEALLEAQKALKVNSVSTEIYNDVGLAYMERGDFLLASFMFKKALALPEGESKAYLHANLGWVYYQQDKIPEATFRLKKAVELDPEYVPALVYLARVYMQDRNYVDTVELLERAARKDPENHGVQVNLGIAYRGVDRFEDSRKAYEKALALKPSDPSPHFNLGILYGDYLKDYDRSIMEFGDYKSSGGKEVALADEYISKVEREKKRVAKRKKRQEAAKKREADRKERARLAAEEEERLKKEEEKSKEQGVGNDSTEQPGEGSETQPAPEGDSPDWGEQ